MAEQQWEQESPEGQAAAPYSDADNSPDATSAAVKSEPFHPPDWMPSQPEPVAAVPGGAAATSDRAVQEENERLRGEVAALRATVARQSHPGRWRRGLTGALVVLCCVGILCSMLTVWASATFLNTNSWLQIVGPISQNPQVIQSVSAYAANEVVTLLNVQQRAAQALPPRATFLAAPLTQVVSNFTQARIADLMHTPKFHEIWININRRVHDQLLAALRGESNTLHISNGVVTLNLIPVIDEGLQYVQQHLPGLIAQHVTLPDPSQLQVPQQARQKLSQALGIQVPSNLGQIELFQSDQLATAQRILGLWDFLTVALPILTAGLILATLLLSPDLRRTLVQLGIGIVVTFIIVKIATSYLYQSAVSATGNMPAAQSVVKSTLQTVVAGFDSITSWLLAAGLVLAVLAFLAGKPEWFRAVYVRIKAGVLWVRDQIQRRVRHTPPDAVGAAT